MKRALLILTLIIMGVSFLSAQKADELTFSFKKNDKGKVFNRNPDKSRFCNFIISGIASGEQAEALVDNFKKSPLVKEFTISEEGNANERTAYILVAPEARFEQLRSLLIANGVMWVKVDDKAMAVGTLKSKAERKAEKMRNQNIPGSH